MICCLIWIAQNGRWTAESWQTPTAYQGDAYETLARIKAASEGDTLPLRPQLIERLGAPFGANWSTYPTPEKLQLLALGGIAHLTSVFVAANLGLMLLHLLNALTFYWVVRRWLAVRWEWAGTGALLFSYNYAVFHRGLSHFSFVFSWVVPLGLLACWLVARSSRLRWRSTGTVACLGAGLAMGCHNTYYLFFWLQLMTWALAAQFLGPRRRENLQIGLATVAIALGAFFLANFEYWAFADTSAARPLLERNYGGTERYALKPVELFIPPTVHRIEPLAFLGKRYNRWAEWRGEEFLPYLGLVGIAALILLTLQTVPRLLRGRPLPGAALAAGWLTAFATVGGVTNLMSFFAGFFMFRATNRVIIFLAAILLIYLMVRLSRATAAWPAWRRAVAALVVVVVGAADQLPGRLPPEARAEITAAVSSDREFMRHVEAKLPPRGMLFQLPVLGFPEVVAPWRLSDYEHFRPYLASHDLRFSYGAPKYRPRGRWQQEIAQLPPEEMAAQLERLGFAALYLNLKGFEDRAADFLQRLAAAGYTQRITSPLRNQVVVLLHPTSRPELPVARSLTFGRGWLNRPVDGARWAYSDATLFYHNPHDETRMVTLHLRLRAEDERRVQLQLPAGQTAQHDLLTGETDWTITDVRLGPGLNRFTLVSGAPFRRGSEANQLRAVGLITSAVDFSGGQP